ncbi:MAG: hypothetical protein MN733_43530, partial [Nitrososphaera sp.]|nr:hypothetical protein [Nitrososphaera sp.]
TNRPRTKKVISAPVGIHCLPRGSIELLDSFPPPSAKGRDPYSYGSTQIDVGNQTSYIVTGLNDERSISRPRP